MLIKAGVDISPWVCEICGAAFKNEVDLLTHQFNSSCERDIEVRYKHYYSRADNTPLEPTKTTEPKSNTE